MEKMFITRRESIVLTAIEIIEESGIEGLSIRTIASRQKVVESSIYKHFKSKEEIMLNVLENYSMYDKNIINTIEFNNFGAREGIVFFIEALINMYEAHPSLMTLPHSFEMLKTSNPLVDKVREVFIKRVEFITQLVNKGKNEDVFSKNLNSDFVAETIIGLKRTILLKWRMSNYKFPLKETIMNYLIEFLNMCKI